MPHIKPFQGIVYNTNKVAISEVVAPPYDVIAARLQSELYERSQFNVVRLILSREQDPYASAAEHLQRWLDEKILVLDSGPCIYIVSQEFTVPGGKRLERRGCIAACRLEEFGKGSIYPHEKTLSGPKEDRLKLFQSTKMMFSQILGLYSDKDHALDSHIAAAMSTPTLLEVTFDAVRN